MPLEAKKKTYYNSTGYKRKPIQHHTLLVQVNKGLKKRKLAFGMERMQVPKRTSKCSVGKLAVNCAAPSYSIDS